MQIVVPLLLLPLIMLIEMIMLLTPAAMAYRLLISLLVIEQMLMVAVHLNACVCCDGVGGT